MQKYSEAKMRSQEMQGFIEDHITEKTYDRVCNCGSYIDVISDWEVKKRKLMAANFCKWAFCPMCEMRKARQNGMKLSILMTYIQEIHRKEFVFLTLTAPNVKADKLPEEITKFSKAFEKLFKRKEVIAMNFGYIRKLEITYNQERDDYHPHYHVVIAVNRGYFAGGKYIKRDRWLDLWRECMKDDSITQVDVRKVKKKIDANTLAEGFDMREMAKYAAKSGDYAQSEEVFAAFYNALHGRQKLVFAGLFKDANKMFKDGKLDEYKVPDKTVYYWEIFYIWGGKEYAERQRRALDAADKLFLARKGIETELVD